jgi:hypothetical protein
MRIHEHTDQASALLGLGRHAALNSLEPIARNGNYRVSATLIPDDSVSGAFPPLLAVPHLKTGKVKVFAVTSQNRFAGTPGVPSVAKAGFPDFGAE